MNTKPLTQKERHKTKIKNLTIADINECFYLAIIDSAPDEIARQTEKEYKKTGKIDYNFMYKLDWEHIDPEAIRQNLDCWIERKMGIFPNIQSLQTKN